ncbi:MAG: hypothetical protein Q9198_003691 [Flavoplaca austrocitrina]
MEARFYGIEHHETDPTMEEAFYNRLVAFPNHHSTDHTCGAAYYYTIDLDQEVFSIDFGAHYSLECIPRNNQWMDALLYDSQGNRFVHPQLAPETSLASLAVPNKQPLTRNVTVLAKKEVVPKLPDSSNIMARVQLQLFKVFQEQELDILPFTILSWNAEDLAFREYAFHILCLALGGDYLTVVDDQRTIGLGNHYGPDSYHVLIYGDEPDGERDLTTSLGLGFHIEDQPIGTAPQVSRYWLKNLLVYLVPRLDQPNVMVNAIADAVEYGRDNCGRSNFNAVLISIFDVVLLKYMPNGTVDHSSVLPLVRNRCCIGMDARQRYPEILLDEALERYRISTSDPNDPCYNASEEETTQYLPNVPDKDVEITFLRLVNFADSVNITTLISAESSKCSIPPEIVGMIVGLVSDRKTFVACSNVSRTFRDICKRRPLLIDDVTISDTVESSTDTHFLARILSSGQQMLTEFGANVCSGQTIYPYLAGSEYHRRSLSRGFSIQGLRVETPFKRPVFQPPNDHSGDGSALMLGENPWAKAAADRRLDVYQDIRSLAGFWSDVSKETVGEEFGLSDRWYCIYQKRNFDDWLLPPNTEHYFISTSRYSNHIYHKRSVMIMIKRSSRYCDCLWDDIIREAKEELIKVDNENNHQERDENGQKIVRTVSSVGAGYPSVILTVGFEVRLFQWRQTEDFPVTGRFNGILTETEPGRVFSILNVQDQEAIEGVMRAAVQKLQDEPKRDRFIAYREEEQAET